MVEKGLLVVYSLSVVWSIQIRSIKALYFVKNVYVTLYVWAQAWATQKKTTNFIRSKKTCNITLHPIPAAVFLSEKINRQIWIQSIYWQFPPYIIQKASFTPPCTGQVHGWPIPGPSGPCASPIPNKQKGEKISLFITFLCPISLNVSHDIVSLKLFTHIFDEDIIHLHYGCLVTTGDQNITSGTEST